MKHKEDSLSDVLHRHVNSFYEGPAAIDDSSSFTDTMSKSAL